MKKQKTITLIISIIVLMVAVLIWNRFGKPAEQQVLLESPADIVADFYGQWLEELQSPDMDPYDSGLANSLFLSKDLRKKIKDAKGYSGDELDPVLCQSTPDIEIATRRIMEGENEYRILVTARKREDLTGQALVTLLKQNEGWYINDITCYPGEFEEPREFSFEREGYVLKGSMLESLNPETWYIIFEENNEPGYSAPLIFDGESKCPDQKVEGDVCAPEQFKEVQEVLVQGQMLEQGVEVKNLEFRK